VNTKVTANVCPTNPLLVISPEAADFRRSEILAFQLSGGSPTATVQEVKFADAGIAKVLSGLAIPIVVQAEAVSLEQRTTLMTVLYTDGQQASVVIRVLPQPLP
jgi:mannose/fructose-specific phosphotransferase system component IIA